MFIDFIVLSANKMHRKNLLQFLTPEDAKKFCADNYIAFSADEFVGAAVQNFGNAKTVSASTVSSDYSSTPPDGDTVTVKIGEDGEIVKEQQSRQRNRQRKKRIQKKKIEISREAEKIDDEILVKENAEKTEEKNGNEIIAEMPKIKDEVQKELRPTYRMALEKPKMDKLSKDGKQKQKKILINDKIFNQMPKMNNRMPTPIPKEPIRIISENDKTPAEAYKNMQNGLAKIVKMQNKTPKMEIVQNNTSEKVSNIDKMPKALNGKAPNQSPAADEKPKLDKMPKIETIEEENEPNSENITNANLDKKSPNVMANNVPEILNKESNEIDKMAKTSNGEMREGEQTNKLPKIGKISGNNLDEMSNKKISDEESKTDQTLSNPQKHHLLNVGMNNKAKNMLIQLPESLPNIQFGNFE